jgi:hypothetical protein
MATVDRAVSPLPLGRVGLEPPCLVEKGLFPNTESMMEVAESALKGGRPEATVARLLPWVGLDTGPCRCGPIPSRK